MQGQSQKSHLQDLHSLQLLPQELEQDTEYEFQVRSRPASPYQGTWSDWSPLASLKTTHKGEPPCPPLPSAPSPSQPGCEGGEAIQAHPPDLRPLFGLFRARGQPGFSWVTQLSSQSKEVSLWRVKDLPHTCILTANLASGAFLSSRLSAPAVQDWETKRTLSLPSFSLGAWRSPMAGGVLTGAQLHCCPHGLPGVPPEVSDIAGEARCRRRLAQSLQLFHVSFHCRDPLSCGFFISDSISKPR